MCVMYAAPPLLLFLTGPWVQIPFEATHSHSRSRAAATRKGIRRQVSTSIKYPLHLSSIYQRTVSISCCADLLVASNDTQ